MDEFCGTSKFWDLNVTWNTDKPDFTPCFQQTALVWLPCAFFWLFTPLEIAYIKKSINRNVPYGFVNVSKLILTGALIILSIIDLGVAVINNGENEIYPVSYVTPVIKIATFLLSAVLLESNRRFGFRTSGLQFLFWFLLLICGLPQLRTQKYDRNERQTAEEIDAANSEYFFASYLIFYILSLAIFLLNCYADGEPRQTKHPKAPKPYPEVGASFLSRIVYNWFTPMVWKGYRKPLEENDLWNINAEDSSNEIVAVFLKYWNRAVRKASAGGKSLTKQKGKRIASIMYPICKAFGPAFLLGAIFNLAQDVLMFASPQLLNLIISFVQTSTIKMENPSANGTDSSEYVPNPDEEPMWRGVFYAILLFVVASVRTLLNSQYFQRVSLVGLRIRTALMGAIFKKALCLSNTAKKEATLGEIVNLVAVDSQGLMDKITFLSSLWSAPLQIGLAFYFLWYLIGPSVLAGVAVMLILTPVHTFFAKKYFALEKRKMKYKDERAKLMGEILNGIKILKLYAWEPSFEEQVQKIRQKEIKVLKENAYLLALMTVVWSCTPLLITLVTFTCFVLIGGNNVFDAKTAFVSIALFDILREPLSMLPLVISLLVQATVSVKRINKFMNGEELQPHNVSHNPSDVPLSVESGTFSWDNDKPCLKNINLHVNKGKLVAVVGSVGAGKSSIISAVLGEMDRVSGRVNTNGTIAYVAQQAWIQNATLQDNILFGKPMDRKRYDRVIAACALKPDLKVLPGGDATEIGEKGINLSGGQKQRVSLARAVYNDADIYLLDDPLSAVDAHVGKHIFEHVIGPTGVLANKTRLFVTHGINYLHNVDNIYVMKDGEISESGTLEELKSKQGDFAEFLSQHSQEVNEDEENLDNENQNESTSQTNPNEECTQIGSEIPLRIKSTFEIDDGVQKRRRTLASDEQPPADGQKLIDEEKAETGNIKFDVYKHYLKKFGVSITIVTIALNILYQGLYVGSNMWLAKWTSAAVQDICTRKYYLYGYAGFGFAQIVLGYLATLSVLLGLLYSAKAMHNSLLANVLRWPMELFDTTPIGRVLNRFSKDVHTVDITLPDSIRSWNVMFFGAVSILIVISVSTYQFVAVIIPIGVVYYFVQRFYVATSRQLQRLESASKSPIYSHFGESIQGASTIRAYNVQQRFITDFDRRVDVNQTCYLPSMYATRWLAIHLELIGNSIILFAALFAVLSRHSIDPGTVGLSVSFALQITQTLNWLVRMTSDVESNMVAVERIKEYAETKQEAAWEKPNVVAPENWPQNGKVEFKNFDVRYRDGLDLSLRDVSFTIHAAEKVGIVGRTGAGKSSLTLSLFRIIESAGGAIIIDGEDISKLGLHTLRSRLTIIPQDPVLFSGTLRLNLDPFEQKSDDAVWHALELAHLKSFVSGLPTGLDHEITEGGENLSVGQRQLVCLARALLRKTKILILDEATAAVDLNTDDLIQKTIRSEFKDCTILTIAHRLNTIIDADKIIVLDKGRVAECDSPGNLLANKKSAFYSMAQDAGLV